MNTSSTPPHAAGTLAESLGTKIVPNKEQTHAAKSRIEVAQRGVEDCTVRSPFDGIVITKDAKLVKSFLPSQLAADSRAPAVCVPNFTLDFSMNE